MEWCTGEITKLNYTLIPPGFQGDIRAVRMMQDSLSRLIDDLGEQSSQAQGLKRIITTADKLRQAPSHILYLLKDTTLIRGELVGLLKVGAKKLYLLDERQRTLEAEPLCVLDFYVLHDRQRLGYGRRLFDHMLQDQAVSVEELAIDGPSPKMEAFLRKNYGIDRLIRQSNNFAVSPGFFELHKNPSESGRSTPAAAPGAVGRFTAHKPHSSIAQVIHGNSADNSHNTSWIAVTPELEIGGVAGLEGLQEKVQVMGLQEKIEAMRLQEKVEAMGLQEKVEPMGLQVEVEELQVSPERPASLQVSQVAPPAGSAHPAPTPAGYSLERRDSQLTEKGFLDLKFYHNKLW